jgi:hypothetical protein
MREVLDAVVCAIGLIIFEALLFVQRVRYDEKAFNRASKAYAMGDIISEIFEARPEKPVFQAFHQQLRTLAKEEVAIERIHNTIFSGIILV